MTEGQADHEATDADRVLVADDEEGLRSLLTIRLEGAGFEVVTAADGREALDHLDDDPGGFDALILDLGMPRMDGFEVLEHLEAGSGLLTIVLSGHDNDTDRDRALGLGADAYVVKPFSPADLAETVRDRLDNRT